MASDGTVYRGAEAALRALALAPRGGLPLWIYLGVPGARPVADFVYERVARNRGTASRIDRMVWGPDPSPPRYAIARDLFLRALAVVFGIAFASYGVQVEGLIGSEGILPAAEYLDSLRAGLGATGFLRAPGLLWLQASDGAIQLTCWAGVLLSLGLLIGVAPRILLPLLWLLYLSLCSATQVFLNFQWDILLLETAFIAIWIAPPGPLPRFGRSVPPPTAGLFLVRWVLFRLMLLSGAVKLLSGDPAWRDLSAMQFHYWTQPLPFWTSPWAHALPSAIHTLSTLATFVIELGAPLLIFAPRRLRIGAAVAILGLQIFIGATGNYGYFNLLIAALCILLIDDVTWERLLPTRIVSRARDTERTPPSTVRRAAFGAGVALVLVLTAAEGARRLGSPLPAPLQTVLSWVRPLRTFNSYGLFAVMTKDRPEIVVEGSEDGRTWRPYDFRYKPDRLEEPPPLIQPHMPRLDWQMWFAALGTCQRNPWFVRFEGRLLEGSPSVLGLLEGDPFDGRRPRYVRSTLYRYRFAGIPPDDEGRWWTRERLRTYCPTLTLENGRIKAADL